MQRSRKTETASAGKHERPARWSWTLGRQKEEVMRLIAISIVIMAGTLCAGIGTIARSMPDARVDNSLDKCGLIILGIGIVVFLLEWWPPQLSKRDE